MGELSNQRQYQHVGDSSARPPDKRLSVMRRYLESGVDFEWPEGVGKCLGNHCDLNSGPGHHIPLIWKSRISDKKASIDIYVGGEQYAFKEAFAVKTIREKTYLKSKTRARNEVENMKDLRYYIKPENILIDSSGAVVLTDFGISRRFPKKEPHVTNDKWEWTRKYASPEIMRGKKVPRDDPSDVFSLGCVFLEMASLILGRDLESMCAHYATSMDGSGLEDAYYCNLERVYTWIGSLEKPHAFEPRPCAPDLRGENIEGQDFVPDLNLHMIEALATVRLMLDLEPPERPPARRLWENFQHVSSQMCRDCDPRLPDEIWTPNRRQKDAMESGASRRRSMQLIPEEASDNPSNDTRDGEAANDLLSANYRSDRRSSIGARASSPHTGRKQAYLSRPYDSAPTPKSLPVGASREPSGSAGPGPPVQDDTQMRRTSSATDGRRADVPGHPAASRSMSPKQRRRYSHNPQQHGSPQAPLASLYALPRNIEHVSNSAHSPLGAKRQVTAFESLKDHEKPGLGAHLSPQKQGHLQPGTQIIIYDFLIKQAYVTAYAHLRGNHTPLTSA
ncbi:MAG: hypothetical protein Q9207_004450 [Kuettlingeria erythrocarpa]